MAVLEKKKERKIKGGVSREDISGTLKEFYKETLEPKFDQIERHLIRIDGRLEQHDAHFDQIDRHLIGIDARLEQHDACFERIEKKLEEHDEKFRDIFTHFDQVYQRFDRLETEYYAISAAKTPLLQSRIEEIENRLKGFA